MLNRMRDRLTYSNVVATLALFLALGGTAWANHERIFSNDIVNGEVRTPDVAQRAITSAKVDDNALTNEDVAESTLGQVPSALAATLGGKGRSATPDGSCDPTDDVYVPCAAVTIGLPARSRVLLLGTMDAIAEGADGYGADCRFREGADGQRTDPQPVVADSFERDQITMAWIVGPFPRGSRTLWIECQEVDETDPVMRFEQANITAVALSDD